MARREVKTVGTNQNSMEVATIGSERAHTDTHADQLAPRDGRWMMVLTVVALGLFLVDEPVYQFLHQHYNYRTRPVPEGMKIPTRVLRSMEDWGENVYIVAVAVAMWRLDRRRRGRLLQIVLAVTIVTLCVEGVKRLTGRQRPEVSKGKAVWHGPGVWRAGGDYQSFPSGHSAAAAAYSGSLSAFYPPLTPVFVTLAVGCAANRVWKERHFVSDCWVGAVFGFWFAYTLPRRRWVIRLSDWFDARFSESDPPDSKNSTVNSPPEKTIPKVA